MKSMLQVVVLGCLVAIGALAVTGCNSRTATTDKMDGGKMSGDKMGDGKMSGDKMSDDTMGDDKISKEKMK